VNGGGVGYSIYAPIRIATETTSWSMPESILGYVIDSGSTYFFSRVCDKHVGMYLGTLGVKVKGQDLKKLGIATHYIYDKHREILKDDIRRNYHNDITKDELDFIIKKYE
jgi:enoyl-CoA hydratase/carnithine racemase